MTLRFLFLAVSVESCLCILLSPLENNDKLKHVTKQLVAEWQWESWPIKKEPSAQEDPSPGPRINVALWKEPSKLAWYLFGGQPIDSNVTKVYSDIWKYSVETRIWQKFFPNSSTAKPQNDDGMTIFRSDLLDEINESKNEPKNLKFILCGNVVNVTRQKKPDFWSTFYKRKKPKEEKKEELKSLAVYVSWKSKPKTVWQMEVKTNLWTAYASCCNATNNNKENFTSKPLKSIVHNVKKRNQTLESVNIEKSFNAADNESSIFDSKINKVEDEVDYMQQHLNIKNGNKKKKINQYKKGVENLHAKVKFQKKRNLDTTEKKLNETKLDRVPRNETYDFLNNENSTAVNNKIKKEKFNMKLLEEQSNRKRKGDVADKPKNSKMETGNCSKCDEPMTWCDGKNNALITTDIGSSEMVLWIFNLSTSNWSKIEVKLSSTKWSLCSDVKTIRYAEAGEEVYVFCTPQNELSKPSTPSSNLTNSSDISQKNHSVRKLVFRFNYKKKTLNSLGDVRLNSYFGTPEGKAAWQNSAKAILQVVKVSENKTVLVVAYLNEVDLWILTGDSPENEYFDLTEKIWRGSALKWFDKYNAALYNLQFVSESGRAETILIPNPRPIPVTEYWGRERGRFIIRIFKNENLKNQSFENRTREQNLTYELLQSDHKPSGVESRFSHTYSYFIIFGISLAIFKIFIFVIFIKRLVARSRKIKIRGECKKSPLIIRYSVIPDDLLQPAT